MAKTINLTLSEEELGIIEDALNFKYQSSDDIFEHNKIRNVLIKITSMTISFDN